MPLLRPALVPTLSAVESYGYLGCKAWGCGVAPRGLPSARRAWDKLHARDRSLGAVHRQDWQQQLR